MTEPGARDQGATATDAREWRRIGEPSDEAATTPPAPAPARQLRRIGEGEPVTTARPAVAPPAASPPPAVAPPAVAPTPAPDPSPASPRIADEPRKGIVVARVVAVIAAVVVAAMVAAVIVLGLKVHSNATMSSLRSSALSTGSRDGVLLSSYDYRNLTGPGSAWSKLEADATPAFRKNFLSTSGTLGKLLTQYNATASGKVLTAGLASVTRSRAEVALFIDQNVTNTVQKSSSNQPLRAQVSLVRSGDRWLINLLQVPK